MMYCHSCNNLFLDEEVVTKVLSEDPPEEECLCPVCGSDNIEEADRCEICGEWIPPRKNPLCEDCEEYVNGEIRGTFVRISSKKLIPLSKAKAIVLEQIARRY